MFIGLFPSQGLLYRHSRLLLFLVGVCDIEVANIRGDALHLLFLDVVIDIHVSLIAGFLNIVLFFFLLLQILLEISPRIDFLGRGVGDIQIANRARDRIHILLHDLGIVKVFEVLRDLLLLNFVLGAPGRP